MSRTTTTAVQALLRSGVPDGGYDGVTDLQQFIDTAGVTVDRCVTMASAKGITMLATELELMERWLAAHSYCQSDKQYASKSTAGASASFQGQTGQGFETTYFGQQALRIDYSGCLRNLDKQQRAQAVWLGTDCSE
jgi:hypothetical protein